MAQRVQADRIFMQRRPLGERPILPLAVARDQLDVVVPGAPVEAACALLHKAFPRKRVAQLRTTYPGAEAAFLPTRYRSQVVVAWRLSGTEQPGYVPAAHPWAGSSGAVP
jgi:hypothetical protein